MHHPIALVPQYVIVFVSFSLSFTACEGFCDATQSRYDDCRVGKASVEQHDGDENAGARLSLLQVKEATLARASRRMQRGPHRAVDSRPTGLLKESVPLAWTHIPKTGTSLINSLVRLPQVCSNVPIGDQVFGPTEEGYIDFCDEFPNWAEDCPGLAQPLKQKLGAHVPVGSTFADLYDGHGVIMLRQPEQRMISMYNYEVNRMSASKGVQEGLDSLGLIAYAKATAGCAVRMMTKDGEGHPAWDVCLGTDSDVEFVQRLQVSNADVIEARRRLRRYAFVGITDQWALSTCLLHAMFGGDCHPAELVNVRNHSDGSGLYDTSVLQGFVDEVDGPLYEEGLSIFEKNLQQHGVSEITCEKCFERAGIVSRT
jgi:hypothetical protein